MTVKRDINAYIIIIIIIITQAIYHKQLFETVLRVRTRSIAVNRRR